MEPQSDIETGKCKLIVRLKMETHSDIETGNWRHHENYKSQ